MPALGLAESMRSKVMSLRSKQSVIESMYLAGALRLGNHFHLPDTLLFGVADLPPLAELREVAGHAGADHQRHLLQHGVGRRRGLGHLPGRFEDERSLRIITLSPSGTV